MADEGASPAGEASNPPSGDSELHIKSLFIKAALVVLGLTPILQAGQSTSGPQFCPPINEFLTPTLLDVLIYPGITFR